MPPPKRLDVVIAGAGPAGLSAALTLGRARRHVLLADTGTPRSWASKEMHGFITRDGVSPAEFRRLAHAELRRYRSVSFVKAEVTEATRRKDGGFRVSLRGHPAVECRKLLIATGVLDQLPNIEGIQQFFGRSVFTCPYCDGWEMRGKSVAVYGKGQRGFEIARALTAWSPRLTLCTNGPSGFSAATKAQLTGNGIALIQTPIVRLQGTAAKLKRIVFRDGHSHPCAALFFDIPCISQSTLAESLGCRLTKQGGIKCGRYEATSVPGVFVAGNIIKDVQLSIVAAAEGTRAAFGINRTLTREDFEKRAPSTRRRERGRATRSAAAPRR